VLVYTLGSIFGGTGGTQNPVVVSESRTAGWSDLFRHEAGGGATPSFVRHAFDGERYAPKERTSGKETPPGRRLFDEGLTFDKGIPLEPRR
jgi:hypothetical protein